MTYLHVTTLQGALSINTSPTWQQHYLHSTAATVQDITVIINNTYVVYYPKGTAPTLQYNNDITTSCAAKYPLSQPSPAQRAAAWVPFRAPTHGPQYPTTRYLPSPYEVLGRTSRSTPSCRSTASPGVSMYLYTLNNGNAWPTGDR